MSCNHPVFLALLLLWPLAAATAETPLELLRRGQEAVDSKAAYGLFEQARDLAHRQTDTEAEALALERIAGLYRDAGRRREALQLLGQALFILQGRSLPQHRFRLELQRARLLESVNPAAALVAWRAAERALSDQQQIHSLSALEVQGFYGELVQRLLDAAEGDAEQALLREARNAWEKGKVAELQDYLGERCILPRTTLGSRAGSGVAVLYTLLLPDRLELLLDLDGRLLRHGNHIDRARLPRVARRFIDAVVTRRLDHGRYGRLLHRVLLGPFLPALRDAGVHTLVLVPDGILGGIPLAALQDAGGRYLAQEFALAHTPGLSLVQGSEAEEGGAPLLVGGLGEFSGQGQRAFAPLPGAAAEMDWLRERFDGVELRDARFKREALRRLLGLGGFGRIHLASHVQIGANAADGLLLTADGGMALDELQRLIARQRYGAAPLDLLTLSACSTAVGDRRAALGLGGLAVQSGARSALASLWQVSDAATGRLMRAFYSRLDGDGKARALQRAQNELIDAGLDHPFYWASFVLIGNWE